MVDDQQSHLQDGQRPASSRDGVGGTPREGGELDRLPPPAFPPGQRASHRRSGRRASEGSDSHRGVSIGNASRPQEARGEGGVPDDAFISPDEPIVRGGSHIAPGAFISPDEPLPARGLAELRTDEVVVTGIGGDPHLSPEEVAGSRHDDPQVDDLVLRVGRLADALRDRGEAGLRTAPGMNRFEATLRAYCVGYLASQRDAKEN